YGLVEVTHRKDVRDRAERLRRLVDRKEAARDEEQREADSGDHGDRGSGISNQQDKGEPQTTKGYRPYQYGEHRGRHRGAWQRHAVYHASQDQQQRREQHGYNEGARHLSGD